MSDLFSCEVIYESFKTAIDVDSLDALRLLRNDIVKLQRMIDKTLLILSISKDKSPVIFHKLHSSFASQ